MVLARTAELCVSDFQTRNLANTAWAFATVGQSDAQLLAVLARAAEQSMYKFNAQDLANTAWAFAIAA